MRYLGKSVFAIPSLPRHEDVLRFQVSVNDSMAVEEIHSGEDLEDFDDQRKDCYVGKIMMMVVVLVMMMVMVVMVMVKMMVTCHMMSLILSGANPGGGHRSMYRFRS